MAFRTLMARPLSGAGRQMAYSRTGWVVFEIGTRGLKYTMLVATEGIQMRCGETVVPKTSGFRSSSARAEAVGGKYHTAVAGRPTAR